MNLLKSSQAGTLESSDIMILIEPLPENSGRKIEVASSVMLHYGENIKQLINSTLDRFEISDVHLIANDKGALEPTILARCETAILRALNQQKGTL